MGIENPSPSQPLPRSLPFSQNSSCHRREMDFHVEKDVPVLILTNIRIIKKLSEAQMLIASVVLSFQNPV